MRRIVRVFCLALALLLIMPLTAVSVSAEQSEFDRIKELVSAEFPDDYALTREDFCSLLARVFFADESEAEAGNLPFEDTELVKEENLAHIALLYGKGILTGSLEGDKLFVRPESTITRQDAVTLFGRFSGKSSDNLMFFTDSEDVADYASGYVAWFTEQGVITGYPDGTFGPFRNITAGEFTYFAGRLYNFLQQVGGTILTIAGTGKRGHVDGSGAISRFTLPHSIFGDGNGGLVVLDAYNNLIRKVNSGSVETITGNILSLDDNRFPKGAYLDGSIEEACFNRPTGGVVDSNGDFFIADSENHVIRLVTANRTYTFCGTKAGYADGANNTARFNSPMAIAIDKNDNIYVADTLNNCIRRIDFDGNVVTIAGTPGQAGFVDGTAGESMFSAPAGIAVSDDGKVVYVADTGNHRIRKIENGQVTTVAGHTQETDEEGDPIGGFRNGIGSMAMFNLPAGLTLSGGTLIVADSGNNMIRAILTDSGTVSTLAGTGDPGDRDGNGLEARLHHPMGVFYHSGTLYIADTGNNKIKTMQIPA